MGVCIPRIASGRGREEKLTEEGQQVHDAQERNHAEVDLCDELGLGRVRRALDGRVVAIYRAVEVEVRRVLEGVRRRRLGRLGLLVELHLGHQLSSVG